MKTFSACVALSSALLLGLAARPASGAEDLCAGLVTDKSPRPMTPVTKPAKGGSYLDPQFGTRIFRVTNAKADWGSSVAKPAYSTIPAWNADESRLILYVTQPSRGYALLDGKTYKFIKWLPIDPTDIEHFYWSASEPDVLFYTYASGSSTRRIIRYRVSSGKKETLYNFRKPSSGDQVDFGGDPMYSSWDNKVFGVVNRGSRDTGFIYRVGVGESPRIRGDAPQIAPSGKYYVFNGSVYNAKTYARIRPLKLEWYEHADLTRSAAGQDFWAAVQYDGTEGTLVTENLATGAVKTIIGPATGWPYPPSGTHVSGLAFKRPGWVAVSVVGDKAGQKTLHQEIVLADVNTGKVCRVAKHRSAGDNGPLDYWAEPHVVISPSGTRMLFGSDWGGGSTVDTYAVHLPSYTP